MEIKLNVLSLVKISIIIVFLILLYYYSPCVSLGGKKKNMEQKNSKNGNDEDLDSMIQRYMALQDEEMQFLDNE